MKFEGVKINEKNLILSEAATFHREMDEIRERSSWQIKQLYGPAYEDAKVGTHKS